MKVPKRHEIEASLSNRDSDLFFQTDEDDDEVHFSTHEELEDLYPNEDRGTRILGRKIEPGEIPAGHIEIDQDGEGEHTSVNAIVFDADAPEHFLGKVVKGRYQVIDTLGEDDTGFAFIAEDRLLDDRRVMIRVLTIADVDEVTASIFDEERISLTHLNHPNVVRVIDSGEFADGTLFVVSEHTDGLTVADILHINGQMDAARAARLIRQAGEALSEVHKEGILHRDLRTEDLVVVRSEDELETVKLSNFGVSDGAPKDENLAYKAPELLEGKIPTVASDVYSLGVIAYIMLTARLPFEYDSKKELLDLENAGLKLMPSFIRPELGRSVDAVLEKVLAPETLFRYPTAREFGEALYNALSAVATKEISEVRDQYSSKRLPMIVAGSRNSDGALANGNGNPRANTGNDDAKAIDAAWTRRSPEPPNEPGRNWLKVLIIALVSLAVIAAGIWYYVLNRPQEPAIVVPPENPAPTASIDPASLRPDGTIQIEVPPLPRHIVQPENTIFFQNSRQNLKGDLLRNFVGFSLYYPKDWKSAGSQESSTLGGRGKFLDISATTLNGGLKEQMLVSYYPSSGTYTTDAAKFSELSHEANETLKKLIPNYQVVAEGETSINDGWRAYEIKFQGSGTDGNGQRLLLWGRRLFVPASRPGVRAGFEITLLATSDADDVHSVDDVGSRGELAQILTSFEPNQNF